MKNGIPPVQNMSRQAGEPGALRLLEEVKSHAPGTHNTKTDSKCRNREAVGDWSLDTMPGFNFINFM